MALLASPAVAQRLRVDLPPPLEAPPLDLSVPTAPVSLARIVADLPVGQTWAMVGSGALCITPVTIQWEAKNEDLQTLGLERVFRETYTGAGLKVAGDRTNLFEQDSKPAEIQVGALIRDLRARSCSAIIESGYTGAMTMDVEWQVYSVSRGAVVARIPTRGGFQLKTPDQGAVAKLFAGAFADNTRRLIADPTFRKLIQGGSSMPSASGAAPTTPIPLLGAAGAQATPLGVAAKSVVTIFAGASLGSGVLVSTDGYVLTNHHVAGEAGRVRVRWADGSETVGEVIRSDRARDVALIKTTTKASPLAVRHAPVQLGETVYAIGTPRMQDLAGTLTRGVVSTVSREIDGQRFIQSDVAITNGNSGGPLLDEKGWVVGLTDLAFAPNGVSQNINFFIPIDEALKALGLNAPG